MDRYIQIKRKLRPLNTVGNKPKINRTNKSKLGVPMNQFSILAETDNKPSRAGTRGSKEIKAPPIYIRKKSSKDLVNDIVAVVGDKNFHVVPLIKGNIRRTLTNCVSIPGGNKKELSRLATKKQVLFAASFGDSI